jgi:hypothetical protein
MVGMWDHQKICSAPFQYHACSLRIPMTAYPSENKFLDCRLLVQYQHYITAHNFIKAIEEYETGSNLLQNYKKKSVDTEGDCDYLQPAFENYVNGHMHENSLLGNIISKDTSNLVDQYLKLKPGDFMVEYLKVLFVLTWILIEECFGFFRFNFYVTVCNSIKGIVVRTFKIKTFLKGI